MHWFNGIGWILIEFIHMYNKIQGTIIVAIQGAQFIACSCDKITTIDIRYQIYIHAYVVDGSNRWPILVCVDKIVDGFGSNNPTKIIMNVLLKDGRLSREDFSKNIMFWSIWNKYLFLGLMCVLPLMETMQSFLNFVQRKDILYVISSIW